MTADSIEPTPTNFVGLDLLAWHEQGSLVLSPKFQRRTVWTPAARSYFIDTLLRGFPVPPLHIRLISRTSRPGPLREVVDGQQRLRALFDFVEEKYRLSRQLDGSWAGKTYGQLTPDQQQALQMYKFHVFQYQGVSDQDILEVFARMNTYSVALNKQELRNGKYFGVFKTTVYQLALEYLNFWRSAGVFTDTAIARMQEAELTSELIILQLDGLQDKKASIDDFYAHLDDEWGNEPLEWVTRRSRRPKEWLSRREAERRFRSTLEDVGDSVGDILAESEFSRVPLFYTLYGAVYHRRFGIPGFREETPRLALRASQKRGLRNAVEVLSSLLADKPRPEDVQDGLVRDFVIYSARQTDNLAPRRRRLEIVWRISELYR